MPQLRYHWAGGLSVVLLTATTPSLWAQGPFAGYLNSASAITTRKANGEMVTQSCQHIEKPWTSKHKWRSGGGVQAYVYQPGGALGALGAPTDIFAHTRASVTAYQHLLEAQRLIGLIKLDQAIAEKIRPLNQALASELQKQLGLPP